MQDVSSPHGYPATNRWTPVISALLIKEGIEPRVFDMVYLKQKRSREGAPKAVPIVLRNLAYLSPPPQGGQTHSGFVHSTRYAA